MPTRIAHIGIAVRALADTIPFYRDILGLPIVPLDDADGAAIVGLTAGESLGRATRTWYSRHAHRQVHRLARAAGIHHICFAVDDLDRALERCRAAGVRLIDQTPG